MKKVSKADYKQGKFYPLRSNLTKNLNIKVEVLYSKHRHFNLKYNVLKELVVSRKLATTEKPDPNLFFKRGGG